MIFHTSIDISNEMLFTEEILLDSDEDPKRIIVEKGTEGYLTSYQPQQREGMTLEIMFKGQTYAWYTKPEWVEEQVDHEELIKPRIKRLIAVLHNPDPQGDHNLLEIRNFDDLSGKSWIENNLSRYGVLKENEELDENRKRFDLARKVADQAGLTEMLEKIQDLQYTQDNIRFTKFSFYVYNCYDVDDVVTFIESYRRDDIPNLE